MYWAKMILAWSPSAEEALRTAIYLNDKYALDGCDPNGFSGIMWSICGQLDKPYDQRKAVFGQIRSMGGPGAPRKFNVKTFQDRYLKAHDAVQPQKQKTLDQWFRSVKKSEQVDPEGKQNPPSQEDSWKPSDRCLESGAGRTVALRVISDFFSHLFSKKLGCTV